MNQLRLMRRCAWRQAGLSEIEIPSFAAEFSLSYAVERRHLGVRDAVQVPQAAELRYSRLAHWN